MSKQISKKCRKKTQSQYLLDNILFKVVFKKIILFLNIKIYVTLNYE